MDNASINRAMTIKLTELPDKKPFIEGIRRAPKREIKLNDAEIALAVKNALRYIPQRWHKELAQEFLDELLTMGRIYGYRFRPSGRIYAKPIDEYEAKTIEGRAFMHMIDNNLDFEIALYPYELVTYGETGQVCQNWMQYILIKKYLARMTSTQTLVISSGHPLGLFESNKNAPRVIITNGLMVGEFDSLEYFNRACALGVTNYGQMTAGGWMYIGPQGIIHGTYNTILNAGRLKLGLKNEDNLGGLLFVSSGLGGMSGAQGKAGKIAGAVAVIAEVDPSRIQTRFSQGYVDFVANTARQAFDEASRNIKARTPCAIAYHGNIVDLLNYADQNQIHIDLLSDQTSCHAVYDGGYCPVSIDFEERTRLLATDKPKFIELVNSTLREHFEVIERLCKKGTYFFDYGNSFMKAVYDTGISEICKNGKNELDGFIYPSYVEDILGPLCFDYGYGPFRWVCLSGKDSDLDKTDAAALELIDKNRRFQDMDNYIWLKNAKANNLVVGSKARILYHDAEGRLKTALKFNEMVRNGEIGAVMLGRDHHDTGGTDSPFRETSNIKDGSAYTADMSAQIFAGNVARGMSLVALHNGGGTGIGRSQNGGFGMVLDGSKRVDNILRTAMVWDVMGGVARRGWARNPNSMETVAQFNKGNSRNHVTLPFVADDEMINRLVKKRKKDDR